MSKKHKTIKSFENHLRKKHVNIEREPYSENCLVNGNPAINHMYLYYNSQGQHIGTWNKSNKVGVEL